MAELQIVCLGEFQVTMAGVPLTAFQTEKVRALLAYLAVGRGELRRSALAQLLWPGYSDESARNSLRQAIHQLRQLLHDAEAQPPWLLLTRQTVQINPDASVEVDVTTFTQLLAACVGHAHRAIDTCAPCLARLRQAAALYRGDFLGSFTVADSEPFEEWRRVTQEQLHIQMLDVLAVLASAAEVADGEGDAQIQEGAFRAEETRQGESRSIDEDEQAHRPLTLRSPAPSSPLSLPALYDWGEMPAVDFFVERAAEVAALRTWLSTPAAGGVSTHLISILGIGGIGKTTLAAMVVKMVAPSFAVVIWRSLLNAPPLNQLLLNWLQILSRQTLTTLPDSLDEQLRLLLDYLQRERCLLVLDNVESIFATDTPGPAGSSRPQSRAGVTRPGYEGYDQLFQWLANSEHQSCLVLTSREQPYTLARVGRQAQTTGRVQVLPLVGLDQEAGHALLASYGLQATAADTAALVANYSGNPLALQIVAGAIADFFGGDVATFQQEAGASFDGMRLVLEQQFARLSPLEQEILIWLAIEREPIPVSALRDNFVRSIATAPLLEALQALQNRSLLEKRDTGLTLQNVIIEYTTELLVAQVCQEILDFGFGRFDSSPDRLHSAIPKLFLNRFTLLKAQAKEYVRQSQRRLILQRLSEQLVAKVGSAAVLAGIARLLDALRAAAVRSGYAGGNLLNLLVHLDAPLTNVDFSHLAVWQADLRGVLFVGLDFTGADLTDTAFTANIEIAKIKFRASGELLIAGVNKGELSLARLVNGQLTAAFRRPGNGRPPLVFNRDGSLIATANIDYAIQLWSTDSGASLQTLPGHHSTIYALAISEDGALLASSGADGLVCLWDLRSGLLCQRLTGYEQGADALAFSPDGRWLATGGGDGLIRLWNTQTTAVAGQLVTTLTGHTQAIGALAFAPNGYWLASGSHDGVIHLWDLRRGGASVQTLSGHTSIIRVLLFLPSGSDSAGSPTGSIDSSVGSVGSPADAYLLASGSSDQTVRLWSLTGELRYTLVGHVHEVSTLAYRPDNRQLVSSGADRAIYFWDIRTGQAIESLQAYRYGPNSVCFSPDGAMIASGSADQLVRLWPVRPDGTTSTDADTPICHVLRGHKHFVRAVAFSPNGALVASGSADRTVRLWDRTTLAEVQTLHGHTGQVLALAFAQSPVAGTLLASGSSDHTIRLWSIPAQPQVVPPHCRLLRGHEDEVFTLAFDPAGHTLVSGSMDGTVHIWDVESGVTRLRLAAHSAPVIGVALSPDGCTLASIGFDQTLRLWDLATGVCLQRKRDEQMGTNAVVFGGEPGSEHEFLAYGGNDFAIYLWPWRTGAPAVALRGHNSILMALAVSPAAPLLVSCSSDSTLRLWNWETGQCQQILRAPGPYAGMKISGVTGISDAQKASLRALGAVEA